MREAHRNHAESLAAFEPRRPVSRSSIVADADFLEGFADWVEAFPPYV